MDHRILRELIRHLQQFEALYETEGIDTLCFAGVEYCLADIQRLYGLRRQLSARQAQAIELFLYRDMRERDVAKRMGVSPVNPVAIYATQGLKRLCDLYEAGPQPDQEEANGFSHPDPVRSPAAALRNVPCT